MEYSRFEKSGNQELAVSLSQWVFKEKGVLKVGRVEHRRQGEKQQAEAYTVMEDVVRKRGGKIRWKYPEICPKMLSSA